MSQNGYGHILNVRALSDPLRSAVCECSRPRGDGSKRSQLRMSQICHEGPCVRQSLGCQKLPRNTVISWWSRHKIVKHSCLTQSREFSCTSSIWSLGVYEAFSLSVLVLTTVELLRHVHLRPTVILRANVLRCPSTMAPEKVPFSLTSTHGSGALLETRWRNLRRGPCVRRSLRCQNCPESKRGLCAPLKPVSVSQETLSSNFSAGGTRQIPRGQ